MFYIGAFIAIKMAQLKEDEMAGQIKMPCSHLTSF
jgi:hypothetical protein